MAKDKRTTISVQGAPISILSHQEEDFISLTDMSKKFGDDALIYSWMRNRNTVEFLGIWERMHNPDFKGGEFETFKKEAGLNSFHLTPRKWIDAILLRWHREQLKMLIPPLLEKWQPILGVQVADWGIKKMKTKWGSCNASARRLWFNLELAKKPVQCLEYIVVHELVHLLERHYNERFTALMEKHIPLWRQYRDVLSRMPLGHEEWDY